MASSITRLEGQPLSKRILVTGGAGFLGSNLIDQLIERGDSVICVDNFYTGRAENIAHLETNERFSLVNHDIINPLAVEGPIDQIYNLACPASPPHYQRDPIFTMQTSVYGSINMLKLAVEKNARILQASTSEVYGDPTVHPQPETYWGNVNTIGIRSCYDEGKRAAESLFFDFERQFGTEIKIMRIFNTYGPKMDPADGRVVSNFIVQALQNKDITIYGDGSQTRSFCFVDDLIAGMMALMDSAPEITGPINIGNPGEFTVLELAHQVIEMTGSSSRISLLPLPQDDPQQRKPDLTRAQSELDWHPKVPLEVGLAPTIAYFAEQLAH